MQSDSLDQLRRILNGFPRLTGYYLLNSVPLPLHWREDEEEALTLAFEALDDQRWMPRALRPNDQRWADYEVGESEARSHMVESLVGGSAVGHTRETVPDDVALKLWQGFRNLFLPGTRFFIGVGLGDPAYVFQQGIVAVDDEKAGCFFVIESD